MSERWRYAKEFTTGYQQLLIVGVDDDGDVVFDQPDGGMDGAGWVYSIRRDNLTDLIEHLTMLQDHVPQDGYELERRQRRRREHQEFWLHVKRIEDIVKRCGTRPCVAGRAWDEPNYIAHDRRKLLIHEAVRMEYVSDALFRAVADGDT